MAEEIGVAYVRLLPSLRDFGKNVGRKLGSTLAPEAKKAGEDSGDEASEGFSSRFGKSLTGKLGGASAGLRGVLGGKLGSELGQEFGDKFGDEAAKNIGGPLRDAKGRFLPKGAGEEQGKRFGDGFSIGFLKDITGNSRKIAGGLTKGLKTEFGISAITLATGFSTQLIGGIGAGIASGVGKIAHGLGAVAALLPAAAAAGVLAFGTLKVAVLGVGDAISEGLTGDVEKFEEALAGLAPAAQSFVREIVGLKDGLDGVKSTVQENFFAPLIDRVRPLAERYLPIATSEMGLLAQAFGQLASSVASFLTIPEVADKVAASLGFSREAVVNLARAAAFLPQIFLPLVTVGSTFLPQLTSGIDNAASRLAIFMQEAERTGRLRDFIQGGLDKLQSLGESARQLGRIFENVGGVIGALFSGVGLEPGGLLNAIESVTGRMREAVQSAGGSELVGQIQETVGAVVGALFGTLQRLGGIIGDAFGPHLPKILAFVKAFANLKSAVLDVGLDVLEPVLKAIGSVLGTVVLPALTGLANWLAANKPVLQGIGIAIVTLLVPAFISWAVSAGAAAVATLLAMAPLILIGAAIAALAALVIIHFDTIKGAIEAAFNWVKDNWQTLLIILTGPIGLAVTLIVTHFDTIKNAFLAAYNWVSDNWQLLFGILTGPISAAVSWIVGNFDSIVSFVSGLPGRISAAAAGMWNGIAEPFRGALNKIIGWWNGLAFPSISLPKVSIPGLGSFGGGSFGGWSLPDIAYLHQGGTFKPPPGQTEGLALLRAGEVFTPEQVDAARRQSSAAVAAHLIVDVTGGPEEMRRLFAKMIRTRFGGDVEVALAAS